MTLGDMIEEANRELKMRERLYPRWIAEGRLREETAHRQMEAMKSILSTLQNLQQFMIKYVP